MDTNCEVIIRELFGHVCLVFLHVMVVAKSFSTPHLGKLNTRTNGDGGNILPITRIQAANSAEFSGSN